ncbi:GNAT family N-acetyltransferase, partial [Candidatus Woesearchaeota archaeon]|nr:GNAT family N-acetyltransferase [Candidatus Woesearchaeota archaeon]
LNGTVRDSMAGADALVLLKECGNAVGALWYEALGDDVDSMYVRGLYTAPEIRGRGGGRALLRYLSSEVASPQGYRRVILDAPERAVGFYRKMNFQVKPTSSCGMFECEKRVPR